MENRRWKMEKRLEIMADRRWQITRSGLNFSAGHLALAFLEAWTLTPSSIVS
jgi:hypothetical protein